MKIKRTTTRKHNKKTKTIKKQNKNKNKIKDIKINITFKGRPVYLTFISYFKVHTARRDKCLGLL